MSFERDDPLISLFGKQILLTETNDARFEKFACEVVSILEGGARILGTSTSWDLGRDGVGYARAEGIYVCVTLRDDVDAKALSDIERITSTTKNIKKLYFCASHQLSEHKRRTIEGQLQDEVEYEFSITVLGAGQLIEVASENPEVLNSFYGAEIDNCKRTLEDSSEDSDSVTRGLRLALMSFGEDSASVRAEVYEGVILETLSKFDGLTLEGLAKNISERLHLMRNLAKDALISPIEELVSKKLISKNGRLLLITEAGRRQFDTNVEGAASQLFSGRSAVRKALEQNIGSTLAEDHFNKIWNIFQDSMVTYCISRGETLVAEVCELIGEQADSDVSREQIKPFSFVEDLAAAIAATSSSPAQQAELAQATKDIFVERTGPATDWLVQLCMSFLTACSLGMEYTCGNVIERLLKKTTLVFDTDILLSLLGEGETDHDSVVSVVERWNIMGGKVLVADPVLEEVAYHAHIAARDYAQVQSMLPGTKDERQQLIENVYVRAFAELLSQDRAKRHQWSSFIATFKGTTEYDWSNIYELINGEYRIEKIPPRASTEEQLERDVREYLIKLGESRALTTTLIRNIRDKARRDAQLYSSLVSYMRSIRSFDPSATCLLVSSAKRLAIAESEFKAANERELITSLSTILHLLALAPNVRLGASAMKAFLFEERPMGFSSDFERTLMRMIKASDQVALPWAKRTTLMKKVRGKMMEDAKSRGVKERIDDLENGAFKAESQSRTIEMLKESLDAIAVDTKLAQENATLRRELAELKAQRQLEREKRNYQDRRAKKPKVPPTGKSTT